MIAAGRRTVRVAVPTAVRGPVGSPSPAVSGDAETPTAPAVIQAQVAEEADVEGRAERSHQHRRREEGDGGHLPPGGGGQQRGRWRPAPRAG